jgi:hypothetical protein
MVIIIRWKIDIHTYYDLALLRAHTNGHIEIAKWLVSLCDEYDFDDNLNYEGTITEDIAKWRKNKCYKK